MAKLEYAIKNHFFSLKCWVRNVKNPFFSKSQKQLFQSICFTKSHFMNLFRRLFMFKAETLPILKKWKKHLFSYKRTIIFVAVFEKTQIFDKNFFSQTYKIGRSLHPFFIKKPQFINQNWVIESVFSLAPFLL